MPEKTDIQAYPFMQPQRDPVIVQLEQILANAGQVAAQGINLAAQQVESNAQAKDAATRLAAKKFELQSSTEMQRLENQLGQERMQTRATSELTQAAEQNRKALEENERNGALAQIARTPDAQLPKVASDLGIVAPDNLIEIDRAIGKRRAMGDYRTLQQQYLLDTSKTPKDHLDAWIAQHPLPSVEQQAAYDEAMTRWTLQDDETARREMIAAGKKIGYENSVFELERQAALNAKTWTADPSAMETALKDFHAQALKFNLAVSNQDVAHIFAQRVLPQMLEPMSGKDRLSFLNTLFKIGPKNAYLSDLSGNTEIRAALVDDATRQYRQDQADKARELGETLASSKSLIDFTTASIGIARARAGGDINEAHWQDLNQKIENKAKEIRSRVKINAKLDGDPKFAAQAISGAEQQIFSDVLTERQTKAPMSFDQQLRMELRTGDLSNETKERIRNLVESPVMKRQDGSLDTSNVEQGIEALQTVKETSPLYYQQRYIDNTDAMTPHMELAVSLLDAGYPRQQVANWVAKIDKSELGKAQAALNGPGAVDMAFTLKDYSGTAVLRQYLLDFEYDDRGASKKAVRWSQALFKAYYATSATADESDRRNEARKMAAAEIGQRFEKSKINGTRYYIEKDSLPFSKEVLDQNFAPVASSVAAYLEYYGYAKSAGSVLFDFDNAAQDDKYFYAPVTISGRPTDMRFAFPKDAAEQVKYRRDNWKAAKEIVGGWLKNFDGYKARAAQDAQPTNPQEAAMRGAALDYLISREGGR